MTLVGLVLLLLGIALHVGFLLAGRAVARRALGPQRSVKRAFAEAGAGLAGWWLATAVLATAGLLAGGEQRIDERSLRVDVQAGGPAAEAGIERGDRIVAVNGTAPQHWDELKALVAGHPDETIRVTVERDGARRDVEVTPTGQPPKIRVGPMAEHVSVGFLSALATGISTPVAVHVASVKAFARLLVGRDQPELAGPVAIVRETGKAEESAGAAVALRFVAMICSYVMWIPALVSLILAFMTRRALRQYGTAATK